jgi:hypothetical protein
MFVATLKFGRLEFENVCLSQPIFREEMIGCGEYANGGSEDCTEYWDGKWGMFWLGIAA